jgi:hypothetical protein
MVSSRTHFAAVATALSAVLGSLRKWIAPPIRYSRQPRSQGIYAQLCMQSLHIIRRSTFTPDRRKHNKPPNSTGRSQHTSGQNCTGVQHLRTISAARRYVRFQFLSQ